jgi:hypothetical protein
MPWYDILIANWDAWLAKPLPSVLALTIGAFLGHLLSKARHQGKIDALDERIKHKDEQIKLKDDTIESLNPNPKPKEKKTRVRTLDKAYIPAEDTEQLPPLPGSDADLFLENKKIIAAVTRTRYKFVFNPLTEQSKLLTFNSDGTIGEGRNANESTWRTVNGSLEIYNEAQQVYSRFTLLPDGISLHHTNQSDTLSIRGQFMVPISMMPEHPTVQG